MTDLSMLVREGLQMFETRKAHEYSELSGLFCGSLEDKDVGRDANDRSL